MKRQAKLTAFLRSPRLPLELVSSPLIKKGRGASSPTRERRTAPHDGLVDALPPWPEVDPTSTSDGAAPAANKASSSSASASSLAKRGRQTDKKKETSRPSPPEGCAGVGDNNKSENPSPPKRARVGDASSFFSSSSSSSASASLAAQPASDSLEDIEDFSSQSSNSCIGDTGLIAMAQRMEEEHAAAKQQSSSAVHPFFAREGHSNRLIGDFYAHDCETLAKRLLGQVLVRVTPDSQRLAGRIVETEAYLGVEDKGAHSYGGKITKKNKSMFEPPGTAYIYKIYVTNLCFNISSLGEGAAVLVRALEPVEGLVRMRANRLAGRTAGSVVRDTDLTSGPGKLCQALEIDLAQDGDDLITSDTLWLEEGKEVRDKNIVAGPRVNIDYAGEWKDKPLRFYIRGNPHVSKAYGNNKNKKV